MHVTSRRTDYPIDRRGYSNVLGFVLFGVLMVWATIASRLDRGDWSEMDLGHPELYWPGVAIYLVFLALIIYKLRHPDRAPIGKVEVEEAGEDTQVRVAAIFDRRRQQS